MRRLADILEAPERKGALVSGCVELIETRVHHRGGLRGMALRTGMAILKKSRPGIIERATAKLLPEFIDALEPLHTEFRAVRQTDFARFLADHSDRAALALLAVAERRVAEGSPPVQSAYARFRRDAETEVHAAVPEFGRLLARHLD